MLWAVLYTVTAAITNTGSIQGDEVPQLYISLGGNEPEVVLRGFDRLTIGPGETATFTASLTRRDLSTWDTISQNWIPAPGRLTVYVGSSSRDLPLSETLQAY
jgi:Fibronectin type III-like domain